jgi:hypothetical protein
LTMSYSSAVAGGSLSKANPPLSVLQHPKIMKGKNQIVPVVVESSSPVILTGVELRDFDQVFTVRDLFHDKKIMSTEFFVHFQVKFSDHRKNMIMSLQEAWNLRIQVINPRTQLHKHLVVINLTVFEISSFTISIFLNHEITLKELPQRGNQVINVTSDGINLTTGEVIKLESSSKAKDREDIYDSYWDNLDSVSRSNITGSPHHSDDDDHLSDFS